MFPCHLMYTVTPWAPRLAFEHSNYHRLHAHPFVSGSFRPLKHDKLPHHFFLIQIITVLRETLGMQFDTVMISSSSWGERRFRSGRSNAFWRDVRLIVRFLGDMKIYSPHRNRTSIRMLTIRRTISWARHAKKNI